MPTGMMIPVTSMSSMLRRSSGSLMSYAPSSSAFSLNEENTMEEQQFMQQLLHQNPLQLSNTPLPHSPPADHQDQLGGSLRPRGRELDQELESKSGSENMEGTPSGDDDNDPKQSSAKKRKKRYHRHTQHQIQELEAFFKECPHPDDKQRKELSRELGLEPLQVKFWFQNKRTQMKNQQERHENTHLRMENEKLRAENRRLKEALSSVSCPNCGGPATLGDMSFDEHQLRVENARLREEVDKISAIAAKYIGKPVVTIPMNSTALAASSSSLDLGVGGNFLGQAAQLIGGSGLFGNGELLGSTSGQQEFEKPAIIGLAVSAMEELARMAQLDEPLWAPAFDGSSETLNQEEYVGMFEGGHGTNTFGLRSEASRHAAVVIMNHVNLVEMLMDVNQWRAVFSSIVSRAVTLEVLSTGVAGNYDGALQVMTGEFQVPSPLVPTREILFVRYCKQHPDGLWAVVDVSLDALRPGPATRTRKRPSGCLIQELPNGYSKVVWVEHVEADDRLVHDLYKPLVNSGQAFGAKRWVCTLERQCQRLASAMASNLPPCDVGVLTTAEGRKSMLKLAERMVVSFCHGVTASTTHQWTTLSGSGAEDVRVMTRKSVDDPGRPPGIILNAATSFWLPVSPKRIFDFLRDESTRSEWDILSNGGVVQEMAHIANGRDHGNSVSLLRVNSANSNQSSMLILQESCVDATGSYVIYAPVDVMAMNVVLNGGDPDYVALLPSGFAILPDRPCGGGAQGAAGGGNSVLDGSLLTVAFQILVDSVPTAKLSLSSVATVNSLIACTVERIKAAVSGVDTGAR